MLDNQHYQRPTIYAGILSIGGCLALIIGGFVLLWTCANFLPLYGRQTGAIGGIYIQDVYLASKIDAQGLPINPDTRFVSETPQIYCVVTSTGMFGLGWKSGIVVRWYHNSEEIATNLFDINATIPATTSLEPPPGEQFPPGDYSVSVFVQKQLVKTVDFKIE